MSYENGSCLNYWHDSLSEKKKRISAMHRAEG